MITPLSLCSLGAFIGTLLLAVSSLNRLVRGSKRAIDVVTVAHFFIMGLPGLLDFLVGLPDYHAQPGIAQAAADFTTCIVSATYIVACPIVWLWLAGRAPAFRSPIHRAVPTRIPTLIRRALYTLLPLPVLLALLAPDRSVYLTYGAVVRGAIGEELAEWHNYVAAAALLAIGAAATLLLSTKKLWSLPSLLAVGSMVVSSWLHGKRFAVALSMLALVYSMWDRGVLRGKRLWLASVVSAAVVLTYSYAYQSRVRYDFNPYEQSAISSYESARLDFFRDDRIKMTLYAELHPELMKILEYRGQSVLFNVAFVVPRALWEDKPWPYSIYFTSAMLSISPPRYLGWGMTTSWLEETVANFGWLGMLLGPISIAFVCRVGDSSSWAPRRFLTALIAILLLVLQLSAFFVIFVFWLVLLVLDNGRRRSPLRSTTGPAWI